MCIGAGIDCHCVAAARLQLAGAARSRGIDPARRAPYGAPLAMDIFISHASPDHAIAARLERALEKRGLTVWLDDAEIIAGVLLSAELQDSIRAARTMLLLWSRAASRSRWVNLEWLTAFHEGRFILPCVLDDTPLPQTFGNNIFVPLRRLDARTLDRLERSLRDPPAGGTWTAPVMRAPSPDLEKTIADINDAQHRVLDALQQRRVDQAAKVQTTLDTVMKAALVHWPRDPTLLDLHGYHLKNAYMVRHWQAIQQGSAPPHALLRRAERRFTEALWIDPADPSALNGLGTVLIFERDLEAARYFVLAARTAAARQGIDYPDAEQDLALIERYRGQRPMPLHASDPP
jgi:TIR domain